jgi:hypothetical protein
MELSSFSLHTIKHTSLPPSLPSPPVGSSQQAIDNLANVLPVVLLLGSGNGGTSGLVLNRRTGYLVGDLNVDSSGREGGREGMGTAQ